MKLRRLNKTWEPFLDICRKGNDLAVIDALFKDFWSPFHPMIPYEKYDLRDIIELYSIVLTIARICTGDIYERLTTGFANCRYYQYIMDDSPCLSCFNRLGKCPLSVELENSDDLIIRLIDSYEAMYFRRINYIIGTNKE